MSPPLLSRCDQSAAHGDGEGQAADQHLDLVQCARVLAVLNGDEGKRTVSERADTAEQEQGGEGVFGHGGERTGGAFCAASFRHKTNLNTASFSVRVCVHADRKSTQSQVVTGGC
jgi:hypothetical protein